MLKFIKQITDYFRLRTNLGKTSEVRSFPTKIKDPTFIVPKTGSELKQMFYEKSVPTEYIWYSPEWNELRVATKETGYLFKDDIGVHHLCYHLHKETTFETKPFYLIGEL
jgi:hypothetical protein